MKVKGAISAKNKTLADNMAGWLQLAGKASIFREFSLYLREFYLQMVGMQIHVTVPSHLN